MSAIEAIASLPAEVHGAMSAGLAPAGEDFAGILRGQRAADREAARAAAAQLVSSTFIVPMLAEMREGSFLAGPFARGFAERQFQPLLDQQIADRVTSGANFPLVEAIVAKLMGAEPKTPAPGGTNGR
jgi:Rod binding domain-containing protein